MAVTRISGEGSRGGVDPHEGAADQSELRLGEPKITLQQREETADRLTVGIVEQADHPEHPEHDPLLMRLERIDWWRWRKSFGHGLGGRLRVILG